MHQTTILSVVLTALTTSLGVVADSGGCSDWIVQSTQQSCSTGDGEVIYVTDEAPCSGNSHDFLGGNHYWSAEPDLQAKLAGQPYPRPDFFSGTFSCDNSQPTLNFYRQGAGYDVYCSGGDGSKKAYAGDRDDIVDGYTFPCEEGFWHWAAVSGFNPCSC